MHHVVWGILCTLLLLVMSSLWVHTRSLENENKTLRSQLAYAKMPPTTCRATNTWQPGATKRLSLAQPNGVRNFLVHLPESFNDHQYFPLIMFYPGKGASAESAEINYGMDNLPAIVVYPYPTAGIDGAFAWQGAPYSSQADDVSFTAAVLDKLQAQMCIDKTHIYAVGMSNGGGLVSLLSCKLPGRFAAYAIVAGAMYYPYSKCAPSQPSPMISIHGDNDSIVPYEGAQWRNLPPIYDWTAKRASIEKCGKPSTTRSSATIITTTWNHCRSNGMVQNVRVVGGEHGWGTVPNNTLWQFLSRFSL